MLRQGREGERTRGLRRRDHRASFGDLELRRCRSARPRVRLRIERWAARDAADLVVTSLARVMEAVVQSRAFDKHGSGFGRAVESVPSPAKRQRERNAKRELRKTHAIPVIGCTCSHARSARFRGRRRERSAP